MKTLLIIGGFFLGAVAVMNNYRGEISSYSQETHARRHATLICSALSEGSISRDQLCSAPIPRQPLFRERYRALEQTDGPWFAARGWNFAPEVDCGGAGDIGISYMGRNFRCSGHTAELISPAAASETPTCEIQREGNPVHTVTEMLPDGTLVLENRSRVRLLGVALPEPKSEEQRCDDALRYIKARLENQSVYIIEDGVPRDEQYRLPAYVVTLQGELFNRELIRLGLATVGPPTAGTTSGFKCHDDFMSFQRTARSKKLGLWGTPCLP